MAHASKTYKLHVQSADLIVWTQGRFKKSPNLYVEVRLEQSVWCTRTVKQTMTPSWNEEIPITGNDSSTLRLLVKHHTPMPFSKDPCVGSVDTTLNRLLQRCKNDENAILELGLEGGGTDKGFITIRLSASDSTQMAVLALSKARQDIERRGIVQPSPVDNPEPVQPASTTVTQPSQTGNFEVALGNVLLKLDIVIQIIDKTAKIHPYATLAWQVTSSLYQVVRGQMDRDQMIVGLVMTMETVFSFVDAIRSLPNKHRHLEDIIADILKQTVECMIFIREYTGHGFASRVAKQTFSNAGLAITRLSNQLIALKRSFDSGVALQNVFVSTRMSDKVDTLVKIENLKLLHPGQMDASGRQECLPGTQQDVLTFITSWLTAPSDQNILWLYGLAGSGKSTISTTIAEYFRELGRLGAFLFFDRNDPTSSKPSAVIHTLSYKLAQFDPAIKAAICSQIEHNLGVTEASMRVQFTKLLMEPLTSLTMLHKQGPIIIIIDALDECGDPTSRKNLLVLLAQELIKLPSSFRFLVTSRREFDIAAALSDQPNVVMRQLDITSQSNTADITSYIHHRMATLRDDKRLKLGPDWPGEHIIQHLVQLSAGLFIWASTVTGFIADAPHPQKQLNILLNPQSRRKAEVALDGIYKTALQVAGKWDDDEVAKDFRIVLGAIVVSRTPLSDTTLDHMLDLDEDRSSNLILLRLRCLLQDTEGQGVQTLHASLADYLTDTRRCGSHPWFIDTSLHHQNLTIACFQIMKAELRFNICELETSHISNSDVPGLQTRIKNCIPSHLAYACAFWADHLQKTSFELDILLYLDHFFHHQFLYWLEVLSLIKQVPIASSALQSAAHWTLDHNKDISKLATDAVTFVSTFQYPISESTPHIYISAIPLAPTETMVPKQFLSQIPQHLLIAIGSVADWPAVPKGHTGPISSAAFSPDGHQIVSGSGDHTVCVWDAKTGELMAGPFKGHTQLVSSVAFSLNGQQIVSGSKDHTVCVWNVKTGKMTTEPFGGHTNLVTSVAFSPDGQQIVSGSCDCTVHVWNAKTGKVMAGPFEGHGHWIRSVAFSPDGQKIVSGSEDNTVRVWDVKTGKVIAKPFEHMGPVRSAAFSPDGQQIVSGSYDQKVHVWDPETGEVVAGPFKGPTGWSVAFSPNGLQIVSGSDDKTVHMQDVKTSELIAGNSVECLGPVILAASPKVASAGNFIADETLNTVCGHTSHSFTPLDGWVKGKNLELLFWLPPYYCFGFWEQSAIAITGQKTTKVDFSQFVHGTSWAQCHIHPSYPT